MITRVDRAISASEAGSSVSATTTPGAGTSGDCAANCATTASSLVRLRPATAHEPPSGMFRSRYSATRPPVNPVAPYNTMSKGRSALAGEAGWDAG